MLSSLRQDCKRQKDDGRQLTTCIDSKLFVLRQNAHTHDLKCSRGDQNSTACRQLPASLGRPASLNFDLLARTCQHRWPQNNQSSLQKARGSTSYRQLATALAKLVGPASKPLACHNLCTSEVSKRHAMRSRAHSLRANSHP